MSGAALIAAGVVPIVAGVPGIGACVTSPPAYRLWWERLVWRCVDAGDVATSCGWTCGWCTRYCSRVAVVAVIVAGGYCQSCSGNYKCGSPSLWLALLSSLPSRQLFVVLVAGFAVVVAIIAARGCHCRIAVIVVVVTELMPVV